MPDRVPIRQIGSTRLAEIQAKLADLTQVEGTLANIIQECSHASEEQACPLISTLTADRNQVIF